MEWIRQERWINYTESNSGGKATRAKFSLRVSWALRLGGGAFAALLSQINRQPGPDVVSG